MSPEPPLTITFIRVPSAASSPRRSASGSPAACASVRIPPPAPPPAAAGAPARRRARRPPAAARWSPRSTIRPPSRTTIWSAWRTVETRCATRKTVRPSKTLARLPRMRLLGVGVDRRQTVVEQQQTRPPQHRPGQRHALPLTARQRHAALAHQGVEAVRQQLEVLLQAGDPRRLEHLGAARLRPPEGDVLGHRDGEQDRLLGHEADRAAQRRQPASGRHRCRRPRGRPPAARSAAAPATAGCSCPSRCARRPPGSSPPARADRCRAAPARPAGRRSSRAAEAHLAAQLGRRDGVRGVADLGLGVEDLEDPPSDARPRCTRLMTQPMAIIGQISLPRKKLKATSSPTVMPPRATRLPPYQSTTTKPTPISTWSSGWKAADQRTSRRLRSTYSRLSPSKRRFSSSSTAYARTTRAPERFSCTLRRQVRETALHLLEEQVDPLPEDRASPGPPAAGRTARPGSDRGGCGP